MFAKLINACESGAIDESKITFHNGEEDISNAKKRRNVKLFLAAAKKL